MTPQEFNEAYRALLAAGWRLELMTGADGAVRLRRPIEAAEPEEEAPGCWFCPVTAVCYATTGLHYWSEEYGTAAFRLELPGRHAQYIAELADGMGCRFPATRLWWL